MTLEWSTSGERHRELRRGSVHASGAAVRAAVCAAVCDNQMGVNFRQSSDTMPLWADAASIYSKRHKYSDQSERSLNVYQPPSFRSASISFTYGAPGKHFIRPVIYGSSNMASPVLFWYL